MVEKWTKKRTIRGSSEKWQSFIPPMHIVARHVVSGIIPYLVATVEDTFIMTVEFPPHSPFYSARP